MKSIMKELENSGKVRAIDRSSSALVKQERKKKELKIRLEKCFIEMRKEFDILCLEKLYDL